MATWLPRRLTRASICRESISGQFTASSVLTEVPRSGMPVDAGFRSVTYPTWKINDHWTLTGAWQLISRPYFNESLSTAGNGVNGDILQASLNYSRVSDKGSLLVRAGQLSTAFGSFLLRYDDADNSLSISLWNMAITMSQFRTLALPACRLRGHGANGMDGDSSLIHPPRIRAVSLSMTNTAIGPAARVIRYVRACGSGSRVSWSVPRPAF